MRVPEPTSLTRTTDFNARDVAVFFRILSTEETRHSTFRQIDKFEGTGVSHAQRVVQILTLLIGNTYFLWKS